MLRFDFARVGQPVRDDNGAVGQITEIMAANIAGDGFIAVQYPASARWEDHDGSPDYYFGDFVMGILIVPDLSPVTAS